MYRMIRQIGQSRLFHRWIEFLKSTRQQLTPRHVLFLTNGYSRKFGGSM